MHHAAKPVKNNAHRATQSAADATTGVTAVATNGPTTLNKATLLTVASPGLTDAMIVGLIAIVVLTKIHGRTHLPRA
jgi:hypothetical protein